MRDTIDMAREAWISEAEAEMLQYSEECYLSCTYLADLKAFEALVRADERSGCAAQYLRIMRNAVVDAVEIEREACENLHDHEDVLAPVGNSAWGEAYQEGWAAGTAAYRDAIRARGNT